MAEFGQRAIMPQNGDPRIAFEQNVNFINSMNALFVQQEVSFSMSVNQFSALSFQEFALRQSGMGVINNQFDARPEFDNRGVLRYSPFHNCRSNTYLHISLYSKVLEPPTSLDYSNGTCRSTIREQLCNSCSAHAATAALEYCLCLAGEENISARLIEKT